MFETLSSAAPDRELWQLTAGEAASLLREELAALWRQESRVCQVIAHLDGGGGAQELGYSSTAALVAELARTSPAAVRKLVARALATNPGHGLDGAEIPAAAPLTGQAVAEGTLSPAQADAIVSVLHAIPATVSAADRDRTEHTLVELARTAGVAEIAVAGRRALDLLDPDGTPPRDTPVPERALRLRTRRDGTVVFDGHLDPVSGASTLALLEPLAAPHTDSRTDGPADHPALGSADGSADGPGGEQPARSRAERYGDALMEIIALAAGHPDAPNHSGGRADLVVTIPLDTLRTGLGHAHLDLATPLTAAEARTLACDCRLIPAVLGSPGQPLDVGRAKRLVTDPIRTALTLRDRGCTFPSCTRPPRHCDAHHIVEWWNGGPTSLDNLTLLCKHHHRLLHRSGWTLHITHDRPQFTPPHYLDPNENPEPTPTTPPNPAPPDHPPRPVGGPQLRPRHH
ncbi:HNH endonuclease signature motif containing protein, partial [Amycolatopsis sulphurea]|uniref:HNH endonuclease signature motif containing protein n=1 Tax=Amycolatopsis sulphurea TaxID=76022 RepID=UPI0036D11ED1